MKGPSLAGKTVLIADDEPDLRDILVSHFQGLNATVFQAENGQKAFELFEREAIDLVISDVRMPGGDGMTLLMRVRASKRTQPGFIFITGFSDFTPEEAKQKGADDVVSKPFKMRDLVAIAARVLKTEIK